MFDIYLHRGFKLKPKLEGIDKLISVNNHISLKLLMEKSPGFLNLNLPIDMAKRILKLLLDQDKKAYGQIYPVRYRDEEPKFTIETAFPIAEKALIEMQTKYPNISFSPVTYAPRYSRLPFYAFLSIGKEWVDNGVIPGALFVSIDKLDGHVWTPDEGDDYMV